MMDSRSTQTSTGDEALALDALSRITTQLVAEQRRSRRWSVFFKSLLALYAGVILVLSVASAWDSLWAMQVPHAALVRIEGAIDANADASAEQVIEMIDIGGPAMVRAAAKNHADVTVVTRPDQYSALLHEMEEHEGSTSPGFRRSLALEAFRRTGRRTTAGRSTRITKASTAFHKPTNTHRTRMM